MNQPLDAESLDPSKLLELVAAAQNAALSAYVPKEPEKDTQLKYALSFVRDQVETVEKPADAKEATKPAGDQPAAKDATKPN